MNQVRGQFTKKKNYASAVCLHLLSGLFFSEAPTSLKELCKSNKKFFFIEV